MAAITVYIALTGVAGSASARVPGMTPSLPAPSEAPAEPAAVEKAAVKPPKPSKASKAPKPVEVPPEVFQREEQPFEPPPVVQKVSCCGLIMLGHNLTMKDW